MIRTITATTLLCVMSAHMIQAQTKNDSKERVIEFNATYIGDIVTNFTGGLKRGTQYLGLANLKFTFSTSAAGLWKKGQFFINGSNAHGGDPSADLIGDYHIVSNIETSNITYLHEMWYRQSFGNFQISIGLQDLNSEFVSTRFGSTFINSSFGTPSTIANNIPSPIFPLTALGITLRWETGQNILKLAFFDGVPTSFSDNPHNLRWKLDEDEGVFAVAEYTRPLNLSDYSGHLKTGVYYHSQYSGADGDLPAAEQQNYNYGIYLISDQVVWKAAGEKNIGVFGQIALSPRRINNHNLYIGTGLTFNGLLPGRTEDVFGIAYNRTWVNDPAAQDESVLEISYKAYIGEKLFLQPDFQYILNPGGMDFSLNDAFAGMIRFGLEL